MAAPTAIAEAGTSLVAYLEDALSGVVTPRSIVLGTPPAEPTKEPVVAIELVDVTENPHLRNGQFVPGTTEHRVDPRALTLDLRYRITVTAAHDTNGRNDRERERHEVVGHVMHAVHDGAVIDTPHLQGSLGAGPPLRVVLDQRDRTPDHTALAVETPALHYIVTPIIIDPAAEPSFDGIRDAVGRLPHRMLVPKIRMPKALSTRDASTTERSAARNRE